MPSGNPHVRLDYVFVPRGFADRVLSCEVVQHGEAPAASDHLPVVADLRVD
jgi:endonuclease/exonuclease/phosphatase family metal-dependent hydrolase